MLKKLFLPLFAITMIGTSFINTTSAMALTNPCAGAEASNQSHAIESCHNGASYQQYLKDKAEEDRYKNIVYACEHSSNPAQCIRDQGYDPDNPPGGNNPGGGSGKRWTTDDPAKDPDATDVDVPTTTQPTSDTGRTDYKLPADGKTEVKSSCRSFLGMVSWDCNTDFENASQEEDIPRIVVMIAANIFTDITVLASYLVIAYIIYGGYLYMFANGETSKVATGKKALNQAFIGLAITLSANIIVNAIRIALMHGNGSFTDCTTEAGCGVTPDAMVSNLIQWVIGIAGAVAAVFIVGGGIMYMTSNGEPTKLQTAKNVIKYSLIGIIICALAEVVTVFMTNVIVNAKNDAGVTNDTSYIINEKESYGNQKVS